METRNNIHDGDYYTKIHNECHVNYYYWYLSDTIYSYTSNYNTCDYEYDIITIIIIICILCFDVELIYYF